MPLVLFPWLIPVAFSVFAFVFAAGMLYRRREAEKLRRVYLSNLARRLDLDFYEKDDFGLLAQLKSFDLFRRERRWIGSNGRIGNILRGRVGETDVYLFDYTYSVQSNNSRRRITQTVFFANDKNWFLPDFHLKPETWWHKVQARLGAAGDINFDEHPEFSEKFWLSGEFADLIREKFSPALRDFLAERPPSHLEGSNYYFLAYKPRKRLDAAEAEVFFKNCCALVKLLQNEGKMELLNLAEIKPAQDEPLPPVELPEKERRRE